jgi:hypothetical protein
MEGGAEVEVVASLAEAEEVERLSMAAGNLDRYSTLEHTAGRWFVEEAVSTLVPPKTEFRE